MDRSMIQYPPELCILLTCKLVAFYLEMIPSLPTRVSAVPSGQDVDPLRDKSYVDMHTFDRCTLLRRRF